MEEMSNFQRWYDKNKHALNAKRKQKYLTDPAYREKILDYQRAQRQARSQLSPQSQYRETFSGQTEPFGSKGISQASSSNRSTAPRNGLVDGTPVYSGVPLRMIVM